MRVGRADEAVIYNFRHTKYSAGGIEGSRRSKRTQIKAFDVVQEDKPSHVSGN